MRKPWLWPRAGSGAAAGERNFIGMVVSTGIGGGIVLDGRLLGGRLGNAGHIGHVVVEPEGRRCACGGRGCLEAEASGSALAEITGHPADMAPPDVVERTGTLVGRAVASVVNLLDLPLAVVSGSVALGFGAPFFAAAQREVDLRCGLDFARGAKVVPGGLGDRGPLDRGRLCGVAGIGRGLVSGPRRRGARTDRAGRRRAKDVAVVAFGGGAPPIAVVGRRRLRWPAFHAGDGGAGRRFSPCRATPTGISDWSPRSAARGGRPSSSATTSWPILRWCRRTHPRRG